mmetsp:Transcript_22182/g.10602  ORF Transcript_22182/g.10602 Transcript_22182/m.10602 type:complete len:548 (-) Transcript_22182:4978-6621(-)
MSNIKSVKWTLTFSLSLFFLLIATIFAISVYSGAEEKGIKADDKKRADIISIDTLKIFGDLERPPVPFFHDQHTEALRKTNKDCKTCHLIEKDKSRISNRFKRFEDADKDRIIDSYHTNCINCHKEMTAAGEKTGPVVCGKCHVKNPSILSSRQPLYMMDNRQPLYMMDKSLHFRHIETHEKKCEVCHHEYDKKKKKLFYEKGKENSCRYCHEEEKIENRIAMKDASHISCIVCHQKNLDKKRETGPIECSGCHEQEKMSKIKKVTEVPRLKRNQPDAVLIKIAKKDMSDERKTKCRMNFVPFDHKVHEVANDRCIVCHHKNLKSCSECHTQAGVKEGEGVNLEQAMHTEGSKASCIGCHEMKKREKECVGCHIKSLKDEKIFCSKCHIKSVGTKRNRRRASLQRDDEKLAMAMLKKRISVAKYNAKEIPEKVIIKQLVDKYDSVEFPHRKVVLTLIDYISKSGLAKYFHTDSATVCQGCHHNGPISKNPPLCGSCHASSKPFENNNLFRPGIVGAYHIQCMGCHKEMDIDKPAGCTECHKEKEKIE